jgi:hypothetical protein
VTDIESRQVNWYEVYAFAERVATERGVALDHHLLPGTPRWCGMSDGDARKMLSLVLGGVREALINDIRQEAMAEASREIASATDWSAVAQRVHNGCGAAYIRRTA